MNAVVFEQELAAHVFAPTDGPWAGAARRLIDQMWQRCRDLGMVSPMALPGVPRDLPDELPAASAVIAAQRSDDSGLQALLRREHDLLNLSVLVRAGRATRWMDQERLHDTVLGEPVDPFIGVTRLYLGKTGEQMTPQHAEAVRSLLPVAGRGDQWWWHRGRRLGDFVTAWETSDREDGRIERRLLVLVAPDRDRELSTWTWTHDGRPDLPTLGRYLMHMAKIRYELRVRSAFLPTARLCQRVDDGAARLRTALEGAAWPDVRRELAALRTDLARTTETITAMTAMRRTVEIAAGNAARTLDIEMTGPGPADDLVGDDLALTEWFVKQLSNDLGYLEGSRDGAHRVVEFAASAVRLGGAGGDPAGPTYGIVTALSEEFAAMEALVENGRRVVVEGDRATYVVGTLPSFDDDRPHEVVLTLLGDTGTDAAAGGCVNLIRSFGSINCVVMVGIAAGVPNVRHPRRHVRLGDIVVSDWSIADYDHVVDRPDGPAQRQSHPRPSPALAHAIKLLEAGEMIGQHPWEQWIDLVQSRIAGFDRPPANTDLVYTTDRATRPVSHPDPAQSGHRPGRPKVHHGRVGSGDRSLRSIGKRDELAARFDLRAIEMEGTGVAKAGFSNGLEWLVVRGISDYGDRRTDTIWRRYAALVAAAYTRALLAECSPVGVRGGHPRGVDSR
jgi:nucleoside phosphorylase